ncbi:MAG: hypothetical protein JXR70_00755 [Spirochaetales bacterium]|nr:hypothetical protein [Spirochaetales bacterium]
MYHKNNIELFQNILANPFVISAYVSDQRKSSEDIFRRSEKFELLKNNMPDFLFIRLLGEKGKTIHFSTRDGDIKSRTDREIVYYNYDQLGERVPDSRLIVAKSDEPYIYLDGYNNRFIYCFPMIDEFDIYKGTALIYINYKELQRFLVNENDISLAQNLVLVEDEGLVLNLPLSVNEELVPLIKEMWNRNSSTEAYVDVLENAVDEESASSFLLFNVHDENYGIISILLKQNLFRLADSIKLLINIILLVTIYLIFFFIFNIKEDSVLIVSRRIKRFQIELLNTFIEADIEVNWKKWKREMVAREAEIKKELKKGIGRVGKAKKELVNNLIDKSWDEILIILEKKAAKSSIGDDAIGQIQSMLAKALKNGQFVLPSQQNLIQHGSEKSITKGQNSVQNNEVGSISVNETDRANEDIDELDEVRELESSHDQESATGELEEIDVAELNADEDVQLLSNHLDKENEDLDEIEDLEEIESADDGVRIATPEENKLNHEEHDDLTEVLDGDDLELAEASRDGILEKTNKVNSRDKASIDPDSEDRLEEDKRNVSNAELEKANQIEDLEEMEELDEVSEARSLEEETENELLAEMDDGLEELQELEDLQADNSFEESDELLELEELEDADLVEKQANTSLKKPTIIEEVKALEEGELLEDLDEIEDNEIPELLEEYDDKDIMMTQEQSDRLQGLFEDMSRDLEESASVSESVVSAGLSGLEVIDRQAKESESMEELEPVIDEESQYFFEQAGKYYLIKNSQKRLYLRNDNKNHEPASDILIKLLNFPQVSNAMKRKVINIYPLSYILESKSEDFKAIIEEKGVYKVAKTAGSHSLSKFNPKFKSLVEAVETKTTSRVINEAVDDEKIYRPFKHQKKFIQIGLSNKGIDLDGYISALGKKDDELVITKSLIQLSRDLASICAAVLSLEENQFKPVFSVGFSNRDHHNLVFDTNEEIYQAIFAQRHILVLNQSPEKTEIFNDKFSEMDIKYVASAVFLPVMYNLKASYLFFSFIGNEPVDIFKIFEKLHIKS